ncbi:unnamed protein product [Heligmosomoides polygyrus]|uniref:Uncharacterized protein n=1 Tax=Heligmosomoides polygyrus TaxID=6339 RepID=A0A183F3P9_HELPZ|nr:unnamed protein product [Heligmosomoides polygyrus]
MRRLLSVFAPPVLFQRHRATYFQPRKGIVPAFVRRFFLRYPHAHLYIVFCLLSSAMIGPSLSSVYVYLTTTPEEFKRYELERVALVRERQKYGQLWSPFDFPM